MDTQKAIEYFSGKLERTLSNRRRQAYEIALEALEKQEAKEVKEEWGATWNNYSVSGMRNRVKR